MSQSKTYIYGKHAVAEALANAPHAVEQVKFDPKLLPREVVQEGNHQNTVAIVHIDRLVRPYKEFMDKLEADDDAAIVVLGELQDPQNVGAVIRSAAAFGIRAVFIPEHNQAPITGTVVKVSAGMAFRIPLISIGNVNNAIRDLKEKGFVIYGLAGEARQKLTQEKFDTPTVFVLGNEGSGLREKTKELCDILLTIPMDPRCESLNASASAAVAFYAWSAKHPPKRAS